MEEKIGGNLDIDQALKEFEDKSKAEEEQEAPEVSKTPDVPKMVVWVIKISGGAIKEQKQAEYVLLAFVVLMFAVSFYLFFGTGNTRPSISPDTLILTPPPSIAPN